MTQLTDKILNEIKIVLDKIPEQQFDNASNAISKANKIFVLGLGRAGFSIKSFGMRLMHMGYQSFVVGETITPDFEKGDLLIVASGSGETKQLNDMARNAKKIGGNVLAMTTNSQSTLNSIADYSIIIQAPSKKNADNDFSSMQPMASLYEQCVLIVGDSLVLHIMDTNNEMNDDMFQRHSNLE